jgi:hypothetical protein
MLFVFLTLPKKNRPPAIMGGPTAGLRPALIHNATNRERVGLIVVAPEEAVVVVAKVPDVRGRTITLCRRPPVARLANRAVAPIVRIGCPHQFRRSQKHHQK